MVWFSSLAVAILQIFPAIPYHTGQSKLLGSSFGVLGINATFDYVVVGGGTSGLVVAKRLAEDPLVTIAVVEAGGFYELGNGNNSQIPAFWTKYSSPSPTDIQPLVDWGLITQPQPGLNDRLLHYTQGKCFGGSSARNAMAYHRGTKGCYEQWVDAVDDPTYTFRNIFPYLKKSVRFTPPDFSKNGPSFPYDAQAFDATGGPLHVSYSNYRQPTTTAYSRALAALGLGSISGFNSGELIGCAHSTSTIDPQDETRSSSETSFLRSSISSSTLQVYPQTLAKRIMFDGNKKAVGVDVETAGVSYKLEASKEVILAAGVFHSPQMLMVSGIGPQQVLERHQIPVLSDLQGVGQNMWDQPYFGITYRVNMTTMSQLADPTYLATATKDYLEDQTGPLTNVGGNIIGWEKLPAPYRNRLSESTLSALSSFPSDWPESELLPIASAFGPTNDTANYASFSIALVAPLSRGNVTIASASTSDRPLISPNWLLLESDQELAIQAFKRAREWARATGITYGPEFAPGDAVQSDAEILQALKELTGPIHHASATCAMGKAGDPAAVVDSHGKVFGVSGLRIVDASAFPFSPPGHIQSSVYMLAEKLADDINSGR